MTTLTQSLAEARQHRARRALDTLRHVEKGFALFRPERVRELIEEASR